MSKSRTVEIEYYDEDDHEKSRKKRDKKRRASRNLKKAWFDHPEDFDAHDEFFGK